MRKEERKDEKEGNFNYVDWIDDCLSLGYRLFAHAC